MKDLIVRILALKRKRRKDQRYMVHDGVVVVFDPYSEKKDRIIDISLDGLAFCYDNEEEKLDEIFEIDLYIDNELYLKKLKVKLISNTEIGEAPFESVNVRRLCGQFVWLTPVQESDLNNLLKKYGTGKA
jgi:hypothetical protein